MRAWRYGAKGRGVKCAIFRQYKKTARKQRGIFFLCWTQSFISPPHWLQITLQPGSSISRSSDRSPLPRLFSALHSLNGIVFTINWDAGMFTLWLAIAALVNLAVTILGAVNGGLFWHRLLPSSWRNSGYGNLPALHRFVRGPCGCSKATRSVFRWTAAFNVIAFAGLFQLGSCFNYFCEIVFKSIVSAVTAFRPIEYFRQRRDTQITVCTSQWAFCTWTFPRSFVETLMLVLNRMDDSCFLLIISHTFFDEKTYYIFPQPRSCTDDRK